MAEILSTGYNENLAKERIVFVSGFINKDSVRGAIEMIMEKNIEDDAKEKTTKDFKRKPIKLYINSYGGQQDACEELISIIGLSKTEVHGYCFGVAASCGFLILVACHKRFGSKKSFYMWHQVSHMAFGTTKELELNIEVTRKLNDLYDDFVKSRTRIPKDVFVTIRDKNQDWTIFGEEAQKYGIIHKIL